MKLTAILLTVVWMHVSARSYEQTVSFRGKNIPLTVVFASMEKQTGYSFFYNYGLIKDIRLSVVDVRNSPFESALIQILASVGLDFYKIGKTVFIVEKKNIDRRESSLKNDNIAETVTVKGKVMDQQDRGLAGASVIVKHLNIGTLTDEYGNFQLRRVPVKSILEISFTGYKAEEVQIGDNPMLLVRLVLAENGMDEVKVIAYGTTTQRLTTGDITSVKAEEISRQPVNNPLLALEGEVPGLFITQKSGFSGSGISVLIQGQNSMLKGNDPFYVIDGVPYISQLLPNLGGSVLGVSSATGYGGYNQQAGNPFSFLNPNDIESISVLKDADATAIYGSRAANGAILITTKKGKERESGIELNLQNGWAKVGHRLDLLNDKQYLQMRHEAKSNDLAAIKTTDYDINGYWDSTRYTDWQKTLIGGTAQYAELNGSITGGNKVTRYILGGTYHRETTVFPGNFNDQKGDAHFNINSASENQKFRFQFLGSYMYDRNLIPNSDLTTSAVQLPPDAPSIHASDGSLNWAPNLAGSSSWTNPLAVLYNTYNSRVSNLISNGLLDYEVIPGLVLQSSFGYTNLQQNETTIFPLIGHAPEIQPLVQRSAQYSYNNIYSWIVEPQISYKRVVGASRLDALIGASLQQNNSKGLLLTGSGFNSDVVLGDIHSAASVIINSTINSVYKYNAAFGRLNYNFKNKYILNLTMRRDGSSRFGTANQFHNFGAIGAAWLFSNEELVRKRFGFLNLGKIRWSYGTTGNDQIGDYQFLNLYNPVNAGVGYQGLIGLAPAGLPNPYLQWELTRKLEFGIDLDFLKDRISLVTNYFMNRSSNELLSYQLPSNTGFTSIGNNFPATVQNSGWEVALNFTEIKAADFRWSSTINLTIPRNKLVSFPNLESSSYAAQFIVGKPLLIRKVFHALGVDPTTGEYFFANSHGTATYTPSPSTDYTAVIDLDPKYYGGFGNSLQYKRIQMDVLFEFVNRKGADYRLGFLPGYFSGSGYNQPTSVLKRWQNVGNLTAIQRYNSTASIYTQYNDELASDANYRDASFIRLRNLALSWHVPNEWLKKIYLKGARIYVQGQNLLNFTHYLGLDPETLSSTSLPPLKTIAFGLQTDF